MPEIIPYMDRVAFAEPLVLHRDGFLPIFNIYGFFSVYLHLILPTLILHDKIF